MTIRKLARHLQIQAPLSFMFTMARHNFREATLQYEALKPQHEILCHSFLMERLQDPTLSDEQHTAVSKMVALERIRESFRCIRSLKGLKLGASISQVEIPGPSGPQIVSDCRLVEQALCQLYNNSL